MSFYWWSQTITISPEDMHIKLGEDKYTYLQIERDEIIRYGETIIIKQKWTTL